MNQNTVQSNNNQDVGPYKATGNLNTIISNPSANINNAMNVNIQNIPAEIQAQPLPVEQPAQAPIEPLQNNISNEQLQNQNVAQEQNTESTVTKTYISNENKPKKKTVTISMGPEFKMALLIIVLLLIFILFLPLVPNLFRG